MTGPAADELDDASGVEDAADADAADADAADADGEELGQGIVATSWAATGAFTAAALVATVFPDQAARPAAVFDCALFAGGIVAFLLAYGRAISRSRTERIEIAGLFFLAGGAAPRRVRFRLLLAFAIQIVVALVSASIRLYTSVAFGVLVPMLGLGLAGLWGARYGRFPARADARAD